MNNTIAFLIKHLESKSGPKSEYLIAKSQDVNKALLSGTLTKLEAFYLLDDIARAAGIDIPTTEE